jgi:hypothetical protein
VRPGPAATTRGGRLGRRAACLAAAWSIAALAQLAAPGWITRALYDPVAVNAADLPSREIVLIGFDEPSFAAKPGPGRAGVTPISSTPLPPRARA